jgi:transposase, IS5 family
LHQILAMYLKKTISQLALDFGLSFAGHLNEENRWVKLSKIIPWEEFEEHYAAQFSKVMGAKAKPFRVALGALLIKEKLSLSDEETVEQIKENPYLQYFIGYTEFSTEAPFDASMMVYFRKRITNEMLSEINERIAVNAINKHSNEDNDHDDTPSNKGKLILDATVSPADIHYPTDIGLVKECRVWTERIIDLLYRQDVVKGYDKKPRTYREIAKKHFAAFVKRKKPGFKKIRRALKKQLSYVKRNLESIDKLIKAGAKLILLTSTTYRRLLVVSEVYRQQCELLTENKRRIEGRIVSLSQPHVRPIIRGKAGTPVEFGAKLSVSYIEGYTFIDRASWDNFNESLDLKEQVEAYKRRMGCYPHSLHVDQIYRTRENLNWCTQRNIRISGPRLGRPAKETAVQDHKQQLEDYRYRSRIEGIFGNAKRKFSLNRLSAKLAATSLAQMALIVLMMNLERFIKQVIFCLFIVFYAVKKAIKQQKSRIIDILIRLNQIICRRGILTLLLPAQYKIQWF